MNTDKIYAESIVNEYSIKDDTKVIALKKLDRKAKLPATIFAYTFGLIGFVLMGLNYPVYKRLLEKGKQNYAFEIVELTKEISEK